MINYKCNVDECDVKDKKSLVEYRKCISRWHNWMFEPCVGIWDQANAMIFHESVFRLFTKVRRNQSNKNEVNWLFAHSYEYCFYYNQLALIRRLACNGRKDVISLKRVIGDIKKNQHLLTRENYVSHNGMAFNNFTDMQSSKSHNQFDRMSNISGIRKRDDLIPMQFLNKISGLMGHCSSVEEIINQHIAHTSELHFDKKTDKPVAFIMSLDKLSKCCKEICQTTSFICSNILNIRKSLIPKYLGVPSEGLDKPFASVESLPELDRLWRNHENKLNKWCEDETINSKLGI